MDLLAARPIAEAVTAVLLALSGLYGGWRWVLPKLVCAARRVRTVWRAFEDLPNHFDLDKPESIPNRINFLVDQGKERGEQLGVVSKKVDSIANTQRAVINTNPRCATFEADEKGLWNSVNRTWFKWTGMPISDAARWGWLDAVHPADREDVRDAWTACVAESKRFERRFRLVHTASGKETEVDASADPVPPDPQPCERWFGTMYEVQSGTVA